MAPFPSPFSVCLLSTHAANPKMPQKTDAFPPSLTVFSSRLSPGWQSQIFHLSVLSAPPLALSTPFAAVLFHPGRFYKLSAQIGRFVKLLTRKPINQLLLATICAQISPLCRKLDLLAAGE